MPVITKCPVARNFVGCTTDVITGPIFSIALTASTYAEFSNATNQGAASDNCGFTVDYIDSSSGTCPIIVTRTWIITDVDGNTDQCDQIITISDTEKPIVDCPTTGFITPSEFDKGYIDYNIPAFAYSDNCTATIDIEISWTITGPDINGNPSTVTGTGLIPTPYRFYAGVSTISYVFTDLCGNYTECEFTITALFPPQIKCLDAVTVETDPGVCLNHIEAGDADNPGVPTNITGESLTWIWTAYAPIPNQTTVLGTGTSTGVSPTQVGPVDFPLGTSRIHWYAKNASGYDECDQLVTVEDKEPPTFEAKDFEDCVERLSSAVYTGDADDIEYNPDYPDGDYKIMKIGDTYLNIDLNTFLDNCCNIINDPTDPTHFFGQLILMGLQAHYQLQEPGNHQLTKIRLHQLQWIFSYGAMV